jgi:hypothetical protein
MTFQELWDRLNEAIADLMGIELFDENPFKANTVD